MPKQTYDLKAAFGLNASKGKTLLRTDFPTIAKLQELFPRFVQRMKAKGPVFLGRPLTDAEILGCSWIDACWMEAVLQGQGGGQPIDTGYISSANHIMVPSGDYWQTIPLEFSSGEYEFAGPGWAEVGNDTVNTRISRWHEEWRGHPLMRPGFVSGTWGAKGNANGFIEGTRFHNLAIDGRSQSTAAIIADNFQAHGLMSWKAGEVSDTQRIYFNNERGYGLAMYQPTPHLIHNISTFQCARAGVGFLGSWGGTVNILLQSADACGAMFEMEHFEGTAGGCIKYGEIKNETMVAADGRSWRGQCVGILRGQYCVNIEMLSGAVVGGRLPALFVSDDRMENGTPQNSYLQCVVKGYQFDYFLHDIRRGHGYKSWGDYKSGRFEYYSYAEAGADTGEMFHRLRKMEPVTTLPKFRVDHKVGQGAIDYTKPYKYIVAGTPAFTAQTFLDVLPVVMTGDVPPVTPPVLPPDPPVVTPPTGAKLTRANVTVATNTCEAVTAEGVTRAKIIVTLTALPTGYAKILSNGTTSLQTKDNTGRVFWGSTVLGTLKVGRNVLDITFPNPVNVTCLFQQKCPGGGALVGTYELIELY